MTIFTIIIAGSNPGGNGGNGGGGGGGGGGGNPETGDDSYIYNGEGIGQQPTEGYDGNHIIVGFFVSTCRRCLNANSLISTYCHF
jgi:hypothetical protein